uniref:Gamma-glutamyltransferase n=2 Tax=Palpitomonas bilix TaxID=652834 RepID=A0A7S3D165_9EUKA|mmetsp:Transcript_15666/g.39783  ORF Transcript_15666/g.39783 Transcript_15666/m.39783 type:complete len:611 (+) Transcript_15666:65-1897(+)
MQDGDKKFLRWLVGIAVGLLVLSCGAVVFSTTTNLQGPPSAFPCKEGMSRGGAVSTTNKHATKIGREILQAGGNVADAAIAVQLALGVAQPQSTGLGGGCFVLLFNASTGETNVIDGREEAPALFHPKIFCAEPECFNRNNVSQAQEECLCETTLPYKYAHRGGLSVGVPGVPAAMGELQAFAALPLSDLAAPAIHLADEGFPFYQHMHDKIVAHLDSLNISDASAEIYLNEARTGPKFEVGETFTNPHLADTMRELAGKGWQWYYSHLADEIIDAANSAVEPHTGRHGLLQKSDFEHYKAVRRNAVRKQLRNDLEYVGMSFPSSGGTSLAMMLKMWNVFPSSADDLGSVLEGSNDKNWTFEEARRMVDVQNTVWADRQKYMGDADFVDVPEGLLDDEYIAERRKEWVACLDAEGCSPSPTRGSEIPVPFGTPPGVEVSTTFVDRGSDRMSTTHFSIADREGNFLSMTTTIEENFGTGVTVPGRGFLLNNELTDFSFRPYPSGTGPAHAYPNAPSGERKRRRTAVGEDANTIGGKRPMSSMSPSLIFSNNEPIAAFGRVRYVSCLVCTRIITLPCFGYTYPHQEDISRSTIIFGVVLPCLICFLLNLPSC